LSDVSQGPGWWQASDGRWYPPHDAAQAPAPGWWLASDGNWYPPRESDDAPHPGWWLAADGKWYPPAVDGDADSPVEEAATTAARTSGTASGNPWPDGSEQAPPAESAPPAPRVESPRAPRSVADVTAPATPAKPANPSPRDPAGQIQRRNEASRADAVTQAPARFLAASRAVRLLESEVGQGRTTPATPDTPDRAAGRIRADDLEAQSAQAATGPAPAAGAPPLTDPAPPSPAPAGDADPPSISLADPPPPAPDGPLMEIRSSPLGADLEHLGEHLVVFADRVELRDRADRVRQVLRDRDITSVSVQRKFTGAVLTVESGAGEHIVLKGIKPEQADGVRRLIQTRLRRGRPATPSPDTNGRVDQVMRPVPPPDEGTDPASRITSTPSPDAVANAASRLAILNRNRLNEADLLRKLADLHRAGVLSDAEFEDKIALVGRLVSGETLLIS